MKNIILGSWGFYNKQWHNEDIVAQEEVIKNLLSYNIDTIDTSPIYGESEQFIGTIIKKHQISNIKLCTKFGIRNMAPDSSERAIRNEIMSSLTGLQADKIFLYQCHYPDNKTPFKETISALNKLKNANIIEHIGVSNFTANQMQEWLSYGEIYSAQINCSLLDMNKETFELIKTCKKLNIKPILYGILSGGLLSGKFKEYPSLSDNDIRTFYLHNNNKQFWDRITKLQTYANKYNTTLPIFTINLIQAVFPDATIALGMRSLSQLKDSQQYVKIDHQEVFSDVFWPTNQLDN
jgi:aryl-alcohol dehydrogenase-like predicted oxidoreductase